MTGRRGATGRGKEQPEVEMSDRKWKGVTGSRWEQQKLKEEQQEAEEEQRSAKKSVL